MCPEVPDGFKFVKSKNPFANWDLTINIKNLSSIVTAPSRKCGVLFVQDVKFNEKR